MWIFFLSKRCLKMVSVYSFRIYKIVDFQYTHVQCTNNISNGQGRTNVSNICPFRLLQDYPPNMKRKVFHPYHLLHKADSITIWDNLSFLVAIGWKYFFVTGNQCYLSFFTVSNINSYRFRKKSRVPFKVFHNFQILTYRQG
jgi:hypothetical protein